MASKWTQRRRPPSAVQLSVAIHAISPAVWFIYYVAIGRYPHSVVGWLMWLFAMCVLGAYFRAIYVGYNWARWLSVVLVVLVLALLPYTWPTLHTAPDKVLRVVGLAIHITAAVLLFLPSSGQWFGSNYSVNRTLTS